MKVPTEVLQVFQRMTNTNDGIRFREWIETAYAKEAHRAISTFLPEERAVFSGRAQVLFELMNNLKEAREILEQRK